MLTNADSSWNSFSMFSVCHHVLEGMGSMVAGLYWYIDFCFITISIKLFDPTNRGQPEENDRKRRTFFN